MSPLKQIVTLVWQEQAMFLLADIYAWSLLLRHLGLSQTRKKWNHTKINVPAFQYCNFVQLLAWTVDCPIPFMLDGVNWWALGQIQLFVLAVSSLSWQPEDMEVQRRQEWGRIAGRWGSFISSSVCGLGFANGDSKFYKEVIPVTYEGPNRLYIYWAMDPPIQIL